MQSVPARQHEANTIRRTCDSRRVELDKMADIDGRGLSLKG